MKSIEIKTQNTPQEVHQLLTKRWSARAFSDQKISANNLKSLFEAAAWSASSMNEQPWKYLYASRNNSKQFKKFFDCLMVGNQKWANKADVLILSLAQKNFTRTNSFNRHFLHDAGAANTQLLLQAASLDIYGHMMGGFDMEKTIATFNLPDDLEPVCFIALGYLDEAETLEEPFKTRELTERSRKSVSEFVTELK